VSNYDCADTLTKDNFVQTIFPLAVPKVIRNCSDPLSVTLDGSFSQGAQNYKWIVSGGTPDSSLTPVVAVTFAGAGDYHAWLYVTNDTTGCSDLEEVVVHITGLGADFSGSPLSGCQPLQSCLVNATPGVISIQWKVTDANGILDTTATTNNPCFRFRNTGYYNVQLIVADTFGCVDTVYKPNYISVSHAKANFNGSPLSGCAPLVVGFIDSSFSSAGIAKWNWDFGDAASGPADSSGQNNPLHTYFNAGSYSINLIVTDSNGCISDSLKYNMVAVDRPDAGFTNTVIPGCGGLQSCFSNTSTGNGLIYNWNFDDGQISDSVNVCHSFITSGSFNVSLVATDSSGCTDTARGVINSNIIIPRTAFVADSTSTTCPPLSVSFTNLSSNIDSVSSWNWQFGDGQVSTLQNPFHIYTTSGIFTVTLIATNSNGCADTLVYADYIHISGPSAYVATPPISGCVPHTTCMSAVSSSSNIYTWNFGDGTVQPGTDSVCYTYTRTGSFYPELILNDGGCIFSLPFGRVDVVGTVAKFIADTLTFCGNGLVHFTDSSYGTSAVQSWSWNFGDPLSGPQNSSNLQNSNHFFITPGNFSVTQNIVSVNGCVDSAIQIVIVNPAPVVSINITDSSACSPFSVAFTDNVQSSVSVNNIAWNFGDTASGPSNISALHNPAHYYSSPGSYIITFSAIDINGCEAKSNDLLTVNPKPIALFAAFDTCLNTQPIIFNNASQFANSYRWNFGDGNYSSQISPTYTYSDTGTFIAQLVAQNNYCSDTFELPVKIFAVPVGSFSLNQNAICGPPAVFVISNTSSNATSYLWNFGDGSSSTSANPQPSYNAPGQYSILLTATNNHSCFDIANGVVTVYPMPVVQSISINPAEGCQPLYVDVQANVTNASSYIWNFGAGSPGAGSSASFQYSDTGVYTISLQVNSINGCSDTIVLTDTVRVHPVPKADFDAEVNSSVYPYDGIVIFINGSENAESYLWDFGDATTSTENSPSHRYDKIDVYSVLLIASTSYGCKDSIIKAFYVIKKALYVPNAMQPGFGGTQDLVKVWKPAGIGLLSYRAQVFDKWGELMWESQALSETQPSESWDGTYLGKSCQEDVYVWKINAVFLDGTVWEGMSYDASEGGGKKTIGTITLIR
ncbi:MAG: hypothetical protein JWO06_1813, partial [Bacteroidota bacterium]|nr:hypothetical protein [Bacteroidota bacterium]